MSKGKGVYNFPQKSCIFKQKGFSRILSALPPQIPDIFGKSIDLKTTCSKHDTATGGDEKWLFFQIQNFIDINDF